MKPRTLAIIVVPIVAGLFAAAAATSSTRRGARRLARVPEGWRRLFQSEVTPELEGAAVRILNARRMARESVAPGVLIPFAVAGVEYAALFETHPGRVAHAGVALLVRDSVLPPLNPHVPLSPHLTP